MIELPEITPDWTPTESEYRAYNALNFHTLANFHRDARAFKAGFFDAQEESDAMRFGTALHARILEPGAYLEKVAIFSPPVNDKTGEAFGATTKAYKEAAATFAAANVGKTIITKSDDETVDALVEAFNFHPVAPVVMGKKWRFTEVAIKGALDVNGDEIEVKGKIDAYTDAGLVDLKTTGQIADASGRDRFRYAVYDYYYILQLAFYKLLLTRFLDVPTCCPCWLVALEKQEPRRVAVYRVADDVVDKGVQVVWSWLTAYVNAQKSGVFESRFDAVQLIDSYIPERDFD